MKNPKFKWQILAAVALFAICSCSSPKSKTAEDYRLDGSIKSGLTDNFQGAIEDYTKAIELNPNYARAYKDRGFSKYCLRDYRGAIEDWEKAIKLDPSYKDKLRSAIDEAKEKTKEQK